MKARVLRMLAGAALPLILSGSAGWVRRLLPIARQDAKLVTGGGGARRHDKAERPRGADAC